MSELDSAALNRLFQTAQGFVKNGDLPAVQVAVGFNGELAGAATFGAPDDALFVSYSITKAITSSMVWLLVQDGRLSFDDSVSTWIPAFAESPDASEGKQTITVRHLLTHTAGLPDAAFHALDFDDPKRRDARFASWKLQWEPGTRYAYHRASAMWALATIIGEVAGESHRAFFQRRVARPLGLDNAFLGSTAEVSIHHDRVELVQHVGTALSAEEQAMMGLNLSFMGPEYERYLSLYNQPEIRDVGAPGAGLIANAAAIALFYQGLMGRRERLWSADTLGEALSLQTGDLTDPMTGRRAHRGLGVVLSGDDERIFRGFAPSHSPHAFGHPGVGGQIAWADPATGISFCLLTSGLERNPIQLGMRGLGLSEAAATATL